MSNKGLYNINMPIGWMPTLISDFNNTATGDRSAHFCYCSCAFDNIR